ncbi:hypothetical protein V2J09_022901 [Rumex salicifolius]
MEKTTNRVVNPPVVDSLATDPRADDDDIDMESLEDVFRNSYVDGGRGAGGFMGEGLGTSPTIYDGRGVRMANGEQDALQERDAGRALPEEGVGMGAHEEEGEDEGADPVQAPVIWTATERLTLPNADPVDPRRDPVIEDMVGVTFDHVCDASTGGGIPILTLVDRCKELCRDRERNKSHVGSMYLLMLLGSSLYRQDDVEGEAEVCFSRSQS